MQLLGRNNPKNIYDMPLVEKGVEIQFEFEFKFRFELKQKKKKERKGKKRKCTTQLGWLRPSGPAPLSLAQSRQSPLGWRDKQKKRNGLSPSLRSEERRVGKECRS